MPRLLRVDAKTKTVKEVKTFDALKSTSDAIHTAIGHYEGDGTYLIDNGNGQYHEFSVQGGIPQFLPGNESLHEGVPEQHLARQANAPTRLADIKEQYGGFYLDSADDPNHARYVPAPPPDSSVFENEAPVGFPFSEEAPAEEVAETEAEEATEEVPEAEGETEAAEETATEETEAEETTEGTEEAPEAETEKPDEVPVIEEVPEDEVETVGAETEETLIAQGETPGDDAEVDPEKTSFENDGEKTEVEGREKTDFEEVPEEGTEEEAAAEVAGE